MVSGGLCVSLLSPGYPHSKQAGRLSRPSHESIHCSIIIEVELQGVVFFHGCGSRSTAKDAEVLGGVIKDFKIPTRIPPRR